MAELLRRPLLLVVRDGWGHNPYPEWDHANAIHLANKPVDERFRCSFPWVQIHTSGEDVGLPEGVMGNSEVGHQNIGAGRIVDQEQLRITRTVRDGSFFEEPSLIEAFRHARINNSSVHLLGLCSDGKVHSALEHLYALMQLAGQAKLPPGRVFVHAIMDGRDTAPTSGRQYIAAVEDECRKNGINPVASVIGRYYAMDRDNRWDRVQAAYDLLVHGRTGEAVCPVFSNAAAAIEHYYKNPTSASMEGDEFIVPSLTTGPGPAILKSRIKAGDAVIFFNFRGDRPRELTKAFVYDTFPWESKTTDGTPARHGFTRGHKLENLFFCTMCDYEKGLPVHVAFTRPPKMPNILGAYIADLGLRQFRCAETEKFPHVTFFFNDYREPAFPEEDRKLIPSPRDVTTYDQRPEMSAQGVTDEMLSRIASDEYDFLILNYANCDMVGHTGKLDAAIKAVETVDECVGRVVNAVLAKGGAAIVTADHGNCEQMIDPATGGPHTAHTTYDVDLIVVDNRFMGMYDPLTGAPRLPGKAAMPKLREGGRLADIAPTLLALGGLDKPKEMTGQSLLPVTK